MSRKTGRPSYTRPVTSTAAGNRRTGRILALIAGAAVAMLLGVGIGMQLAGPSSAESQVESLRRQEAQRDAAQIKELTQRARQTATAIKPIADGLAAPEAVTAEQVKSWQKTIGDEVKWYAVTVSGMTATNVARGTLRSAVEQFAVAVDTAALAQSAPAAQRASLLALAGRQRALAVTAWSVAATQLDQISVDAGNGHQHVYLQTGGVDGAMVGDSHPEGTD